MEPRREGPRRHHGAWSRARRAQAARGQASSLASWLRCVAGALALLRCASTLRLEAGLSQRPSLRKGPSAIDRFKKLRPLWPCAVSWTTSTIARLVGGAGATSVKGNGLLPPPAPACCCSATEAGARCCGCGGARERGDLPKCVRGGLARTPGERRRRTHEARAGLVAAPQRLGGVGYGGAGQVAAAQAACVGLEARWRMSQVGARQVGRFYCEGRVAPRRAAAPAVAPPSSMRTSTRPTLRRRCAPPERLLREALVARQESVEEPLLRQVLETGQAQAAIDVLLHALAGVAGSARRRQPPTRTQFQRPLAVQRGTWTTAET